MNQHCLQAFVHCIFECKEEFRPAVSITLNNGRPLGLLGIYCFVSQLVFFSRPRVLLSVEQVDPLPVPQLLEMGIFVIFVSLAVMLSNFYATSTQAGKNNLVDPCLLQPSTTNVFGLKCLIHSQEKAVVSLLCDLPPVNWKMRSCNLLLLLVQIPDQNKISKFLRLSFPVNCPQKMLGGFFFHTSFLACYGQFFTHKSSEFWEQTFKLEKNVFKKKKRVIPLDTVQ